MTNMDENNDQGYSLASIKQVANGDETFVQTLIEAFRTEVEEITRDLNIALSNKNMEQINRLAHKIKPTLQQFEMVTLHKQSLELENLGEEHDMKEVKNKVKDFIEGLREMKVKVG